MKNLKLIAAAIAALAIGTLAFADAAADNYLSKFTELVTTAEACAKKNETAKAETLAAKKEKIDELRKTVTLSTTQRFSDWLLSRRYDAALTKLEASATATSAANKAEQKAGQLGDAIDGAAKSAGNALKKAGSQAVDSVKETAAEAKTAAQETAKTKVEGAANDAAGAIGEKLKQGADAVANAFNSLFGGEKKESD